MGVTDIGSARASAPELVGGLAASDTRPGPTTAEDRRDVAVGALVGVLLLVVSLAAWAVLAVLASRLLA